MLPEEELASEVQALLVEKLMAPVASLDTDLLEAGVLDSLTLVALLMNLEEHFGLKVVMEKLEVDDLRSIRSIARLVASQKRACATV
jgi:acyl carrier protein